MKIIIILILGILIGENHEMNNLSENLKPFEPYINKTYKGEFATSTKENPIFDISYWERILNGMAIKITHSVNDGEYGGISIITWDAKKNSLVSSYFTTAGFTTNALMHFKDGKLISVEEVTGNENGIIKVKAIFEFLENGDLQNSSKYLMNGEWVDGHKIYYKEAHNAKIIFK